MILPLFLHTASDQILEVGKALGTRIIDMGLEVIVGAAPDLQDFSCHCREINSKVMNIMDELITKQLAKVQRVHVYQRTHY